MTHGNKQKILVLGVGAIGSNLTNRLVADLKGSAEITVLDMDTVEERNVIAGTQFYMRDQIGMSKVEALQYNIYKFHEREINIINKKLTLDYNGTFAKLIVPVDLVIDCLDNHEARKIAQTSVINQNKAGVSQQHLLHIGFSDQFTFAVEWAENYKVPEDIISGMDICEMEGASSFVNYVASIGSMVVQNYLKDGTKDDVLGGKMRHSIIR